MIKKQEEMRETARLLSIKGKGLLAVDESMPTIGMRLANINEINKYLDVLEAEGKVEPTRQERGIFY